MTYQFQYEIFEDISHLNEADKSLLNEAKKATQLAYAPYSQFHVGAAALLEDSAVLHGSNQENASYPAGICAERVLLSALSSLHPQKTINTLAISYNNLNGESSRPISPCGICRQSLLEQEIKQHSTIRIILGGLSGNIYIIPQAKLLLPLSFSADDMK